MVHVIENIFGSNGAKAGARPSGLTREHADADADANADADAKANDTAADTANGTAIANDEPTGEPTGEPTENRGGADRAHRLTVRLDASDIEEQLEERPQQLQVVARRTDDTLETAPVEFDDCEATAELPLEEDLGAVGIYVGPVKMSPEELIRTQTLTENVPTQRWVETPELELDPIRPPPYYWDRWHRRCRTVAVTGKLTCPDGSPVPGAEVCAMDVDGWFYWLGTQQVCCATTDLDGTFEIGFRWCCGFWPWWWHHRTWRPDDRLVERIEAATRDVTDLSLANGGHRPGLTVFEELLEDAPVSVDEPVAELGPDRLEQLRTDLVERLPRAPLALLPSRDLRPVELPEPAQAGLGEGHHEWARSTHTGHDHKTNDPRETYGRALDQGAARPDWEGGEYTLRMAVEEAFPEDCCYQLVLKARRRTIANCHARWPHRNRSEYSIGYGI